MATSVWKPHALTHLLCLFRLSWANINIHETQEGSVSVKQPFLRRWTLLFATLSHHVALQHQTVDVACDPCHRTGFDVSVAGLCSTVRRCLPVGLCLGWSTFVATISPSCANQHVSDLTDEQQYRAESLSCCGLRTRRVHRYSYALVPRTVNLILRPFFSEFIIPSLDPGFTYGGPSVSGATPCECNTITYNLIAACSICQNRIYIA